MMDDATPPLEEGEFPPCIVLLIEPGPVLDEGGLGPTWETRIGSENNPPPEVSKDDPLNFLVGGTLGADGPETVVFVGLEESSRSACLREDLELPDFEPKAIKSPACR